MSIQQLQSNDPPLDKWRRSENIKAYCVFVVSRNCRHLLSLCSAEILQNCLCGDDDGNKDIKCANINLAAAFTARMVWMMNQWQGKYIVSSDLRLWLHNHTYWDEQQLFTAQKRTTTQSKKKKKISLQKKITVSKVLLMRRCRLSITQGNTMLPFWWIV